MIALICLSAPIWVPFAILGLFRAVWFVAGFNWRNADIDTEVFVSVVIGLLIGLMMAVAWWRGVFV